MSKSSFEPLIAPHPPQCSSPKSPLVPAWRRGFALLLVGACALYLSSNLISQHTPYHRSRPCNHAPKCAQTAALQPKSTTANLDGMLDYLSSDAFANETVAHMTGAIQIRTESFDDLGPVGEDARWEVFVPFHEYLAATFPRIHKELRLEKINTHGLLYTWSGSNATLKPTLLMAHQDTVPVPPETVDSWTYPPFSGHFDGKYIWGRGAVDCKNNLIAALETVELLLQADFTPQRTLLLSFGFDEESSGREGAGHLAPFLLERYGSDGIAVIVDEGMGYAEAFGRGFAVPGVAEKGYTDVDIVVRSPGGHSSVPYDHTSIGILSELITVLEAHPYPTYLDDANPYLGFLNCGAEHATGFPKKLKKLLSQRRSSKKTCAASKYKDELAIEAAKLGPEVRYLMQTSQAVDLIQGGVKINAMPETARATVNHRINIGDTPSTAWNHIAALARPIAEKHGLAFSDYPYPASDAGARSISVTARDTVLSVAPITPTDISSVTPYNVLAGTIRALFGEDTVVAPAMMTGNTDTRYYWDLTKHIFRFGPGTIGDSEEGLGNIHTVDERLTLANHVKTVKWFTLFVRNMDEAVL